MTREKLKSLLTQLAYITLHEGKDSSVQIDVPVTGGYGVLGGKTCK